jgi:hypothetical protein
MASRSLVHGKRQYTSLGPAAPRLTKHCTASTLAVPVGAFELDYDTGVVRFRTRVDVESTELVPALVCMMLYGTRHLSDAYHAMVLAVAFGGVIPKVAVEAARRRLGTSSAPDRVRHHPRPSRSSTSTPSSGVPRPT